MLSTPVLLIFGSMLLGSMSAPIKGSIKVAIDAIRENFIFTVVIYQKDELFHATEAWLSENYASKYKDVEGGYNFRSSDDKFKKLSIRHSDTVFNIRWKRKKIWFHFLKEKLEHSNDISQLFALRFYVWGYRAKVQILDLLNHITDEYNKKNVDDRLEVRTMSKYDGWTLFNKKWVKPIDAVVLDPEVKSKIITDLDKFTSSEQWYRDNNIPYKRSYCFYGPPGTGKTSLAFAIAAYLKKTICILTPNSITDDTELNNAFKNLPDNSVLLMEDIDGCFVQRDNTKESKFSFSSLLNCLDGAMSKHGMIIIMTTNHIEILDAALLREGRTDFKQEIGPASTKEIESYLRGFYLDDSITLNREIIMPMSKVQEICIRNRDNKEKGIMELTTPLLKVA